jgi:putative flippase GtrA
MDINTSRLPKEVFGFLFVGSISFVIDFSVFNLLVLWGTLPATANLIAICCASVYGFIGNSLYSFKHRFNLGSRALITLKYFLFALLSVVVSAALTTLVLAALSNQGLIEQNLGRTAVILSLVLVRFLGLKFVVYYSPKRLEAK